MRHPQVRTASCADWLPETHDRIREIILVFLALLPFKADDVAIAGATSRGTAQFHSDADLHIETGTDERLEEAKRIIANEGRQQWYGAVKYLKATMLEEFGLQIKHLGSLMAEEPSTADNKKKICYRIVEQRWYNENAKEKVIFDTNVKDWVPVKPRPTPARPPVYFFTGTDPETQNLVPWKDDYDWCVDDWRQRLKGKMLEIGTLDTAHLQPTKKRDQFRVKQGSQR